MTPFEWVIAAIAVTNFLIATVGGAIWKTQKDKVKNEELKAFIDTVVKSAEVLKDSKQLTISKPDYVWTLIEKEYPGAAKNKTMVEALIHASLHSIGAGISEKE